jgi:ribonuclease HII
MRPEEIEALGEAGVHGAEIMLAKGIARNEIMVYLQGVKTDEAKKALIKGLRLYHDLHKNAKVTPAELGFAQRTKSADGLLYFFWVYEHLLKSQHPDDKQASSLAIAAASVVAKVTRDRMMVELADEFPEYGFERHKGYGTKAHLEALRRHGPCPVHRRSFQPVAQLELPMDFE